MGTKPTWKALNIQMDPSLYAAVKAAANTSERSVSAWVRLACRQALNRTPDGLMVVPKIKVDSPF